MRARQVLKALTLFAAVSCIDATGPNLEGNAPGYAITDVRVTPSNATILIPDTITAANAVQYSATAIGRDNQPLVGTRFVWKTSDPAIATIDDAGLLTPVMPGTVEITASAYRVGKATLVILPATASVQLSPTRDSIFVDEPIVTAGDTIRLVAKAIDPNGQQVTGVAFTWTSSAPTVATVQQDGTVHAVSLGNTTIVVSANGLSASSIVSVVPVVARVDLSTPALQVLALDTLQLTAAASDYNGAPMGRSFTWTSSNPTVATVDETGRVMFLAAGSATITARTAFRTASVTITAFERRLLVMDAAADYTCGLTALGRGYCWGNAGDGRTAAAADSSCFPGPEPCILPPKRMNRPDLVFSSISTGGTFACGIVTEQVYCWGNDEFGQIGNGQDGAGATPSVATVKSHRFTAVTAGATHACALNLVGTAYCWGNDNFGQLGDNLTVNSTTPIPVADTTLSFRAISAGDSHTCALTTAGAAWCWGNNEFGQLGIGSSGNVSLKPALVLGGITFNSISAGARHTCAIDTTSNVYCWGDNSGGQLGLGVSGGNNFVPTALPGASGYTAISAGFVHNCGISAGTVRCWGTSNNGEVGDGNENQHVVLAPTTVVGLTASSVTVGLRHSCAITTTGTSMCWGSNRFGVLGNEYQAVIRATPQVVARPR